MQYCIYPLQKEEEYLHFFEARRVQIEKYLPLDYEYYQDKYEIDYYDLYSKHFGLRLIEKGNPSVIGFGRLTRNSPEAHLWKRDVPRAVKAFIHEALNQGVLNPKPYLFPVLEKFQDNEEFCRILKKSNKVAELGRLVVLGNQSYPYLPLNLVCYMWATAMFEGLDFLTIHSSQKHARFHDYYFKAFFREKSSTSLYVPSIYKLNDYSPRAKLIGNILEVFRETQSVVPILFRGKEVLGIEKETTHLKVE